MMMVWFESVFPIFTSSKRPAWMTTVFGAGAACDQERLMQESERISTGRQWPSFIHPPVRIGSWSSTLQLWVGKRQPEFFSNSSTDSVHHANEKCARYQRETQRWLCPRSRDRGLHPCLEKHSAGAGP